VRVSLREIIDRHGPDPLRYFLLREVPWDGDGSFSFERFDIRYIADLADGYGNLVSRVLAMVDRYLGGVVPTGTGPATLDAARDKAWQRYTEAMDRHLLHEGAAAALRLVADANGYIEAEVPWVLSKHSERRPQLEQVLRALTDAVQAVTIMLVPFMPTKTAEVWRALGNESPQVTPVTGSVPGTAGHRVKKTSPLFPKPQAST